MNKKKTLLFLFAALLSGSTLIAQTGQWKLAGNGLNGTQKLGSTNNFPIDFFTNNVKRMSLTNTGNLRFNSDQLSIQFPNPGSTPKPMMFLYESGGSNKARMIMAYSSGFPSFGLRTDGFNKFDFTDGINSALTVDLGPDNVGVNTISPKTRLHVLNGSSGVSPIANTTITAENNTNNYISVLTPSASESGVLFGNPGNAASGGIVYNSFGSSNGLQFRTNGNATHMVLTAAGNVGIGTTNPIAQLDISGSNNNAIPGLFISKEDRNAAVLNNRSLFSTVQVTNEVGLAIFAYSFNGDAIFAQTDNLNAFAGNFSGDVFTTGTYQGSDEKLKQNISDFTNAMSMINKLQPKHYEFKKDGDYSLMHLPRGDHYGLIAQDVEKILPNLVKQTKFDKHMKPGADMQKSSPSDVINFKALNYTEFIPIIIKGMQELSTQNDELKKQNEEQQKQIDELKAIVLKGNQSSASSNATINTSLTDASLGQNTPNPFTNTTSIRYTLPQKFTTAQIIITDKSGKTIKQLNISGAGKSVVNVEASALSAGTYNYSLVVDGKIISTKQMVLTK